VSLQAGTLRKRSYHEVHANTAGIGASIVR
jgi:hypothetical protein